MLLLAVDRSAAVAKFVRYIWGLLLGSHVPHQVAGDLLDLLQVRHVLGFVLNALLVENGGLKNVSHRNHLAYLNVVRHF